MKCKCEPPLKRATAVFLCGYRWCPIRAAVPKSRIHQGDPEDNVNSGYFAPWAGDTSRPRIRSARRYPLPTPIAGSKGGSRGWTSARVSGEQSGAERSRAEQQRAARTRRPFAYFTGNLRASIRQGNCKNGGVIYLSLPPWARSLLFPGSLSRAPLFSLGSLCARARTHTQRLERTEENSSICPRADKGDLSFRSELPRPPNCVIEIRGRSVIRQDSSLFESRSPPLFRPPRGTRNFSHASQTLCS